MSYRADSSESAFPASWRTVAEDNFCPSVSSCWMPLHSNPRRRLEAATQSLPQLGFALAVAAPWWSSRNSPLNRSEGGLLTGSLSLTVRSWHSVPKLQRATARGFYLCPCLVETRPIWSQTRPIRSQTHPIQAPRPVAPAVLDTGQCTLYPHWPQTASSRRLRID